MTDDGDWTKSRRLRLHEATLEKVILLKTQVDRSGRQRPTHKSRVRLREVQRAALYRRHGGIERAGIKIKREILRVVAGERAVGDWPHNLNYRCAGQIGGKGGKNK